VSDEIPQGSLPSRPVLEMTSPVDDMDGNVHSNDVERVSPESREELEIPQLHDALVTHPSSDALEDEHSLTVDLEPAASARKVSPLQHRVAHDDLKTSSHDSPLVVRSIPDDNFFGNGETCSE